MGLVKAERAGVDISVQQRRKCDGSNKLTTHLIVTQSGMNDPVVLASADAQRTVHNALADSGPDSGDVGAVAASSKGFKSCTYRDLTTGEQCVKRSFSRGLCRKHGGNHCEVEGCTRDRGRLRMCVQHFYEHLPKDENEYTAQQRNDLEKLNRKQQICKYDGCDKQMVVKQYCVVHARNVLGDDTVNSVYHRPSVKCKYEGCEKRYSVKGYCLKHGRELLDPEVIKEFQVRNNAKGRRNYHKKKEREAGLDGAENSSNSARRSVLGEESSSRVGPQPDTQQVSVDDMVAVDVVDNLAEEQPQPEAMSIQEEGGALLSQEVNEEDAIDPKPRGAAGRKPTTTRKIYCKVENCSKIRVRQGYCTAHLREMTDSGADLLKEMYKKNSKVCRVEGCSKHVSLKGFCLAHAHDHVSDTDVREYLDKKKEQSRRG